MTTSDLAVFDVLPPTRFERLQLLLRLLVSVVLGLLGLSLGWLFLVVYFALPAVAAIVVSAHGAERYLGETGPAIVRLSRWLLSFQAYMSFLTDRFPTGEESLVRYEVTPTGTPTASSALWRLLASLPEFVVLAILGLVAAVVWILSALFVLFTADIPEALLGFQRGLLGRQARLLAYHASLVTSL